MLELVFNNVQLIQLRLLISVSLLVFRCPTQSSSTLITRSQLSLTHPSLRPSVSILSLQLTKLVLPSRSNSQAKIVLVLSSLASLSLQSTLVIPSLLSK